ncbi:unnamed protein product [Rotaria sp. Silwood1]|nr:unnamed protein product [Rotaria sp. Silwood1]CAF1279740.1 unnamed protein product [Rotaria sp. Silwood1]CAF3496343.1 unnamed protein product [Rotaria sp. Silwood1]CAF4681657.1 unnamed protein product [Rotaria sp. Silwood1]
MSDLTNIMTFELLPNEILIKCFGYLNAIDIFHSFDQLNSRFNKLIRIIPLYLSFENVRKRIFDQFCKKILLNSEIKNQIISLKLSNINTYGQIDGFLSLFSLTEFSNLQSLVLNRVKITNLEKLQSILPLISKLDSFCLIDYNYNLSSKHLNELYELFSYIPMLKYLNIHNVWTYFEGYISKNNTISNRRCAINLQKIIINNFQHEFQDFKIFVEQTPNIKYLTICSNDKTMIDAYNWQTLIITSLSYLISFKFKFIYSRKDDDDDDNNNTIIDKFEQFQSNFWQDQHFWNTEYVLDKNLAYVYTIPYISDTYMLTPYTNRYCKKSINTLNIFNNVTNLILYEKIIRDKCEFYFSNVESLTLENVTDTLEYNNNYFLCVEHVQFLKTIVNLINLKHLNISSKCNIDVSPVLLEILKQSPQLSSLIIDLFALSILFNNDELCRHLNKMINKLDVYKEYDDKLNEFHTITKLCQVFSNLEQLKCNIRQLDSLLFILNNLSKLSFLCVVVSQIDEHFIDQFKHELLKLNVMHEIEYDYSTHGMCKVDICIWIN